MARDHVIVVDQGTTGTTTMIFDAEGKPAGKAYRELTQHYPAAGLVEHDPEEIWRSVVETLEEVVRKAGVPRQRIAGLGITNQRETTLVWERATGRPSHRAIVWQDRRTTEDCRRLIGQGLELLVSARTGLKLDPYFSGTKIRWLLGNVPDLKSKALRGESAFGTVDTWILWKLTGGSVHATDWTNASRTLLFNIHERAWDKTLLQALDVPMTPLPRVEPSSHVFGEVLEPAFLSGVPIGSLVGDQQAALAGQGCFRAGEVKNTYGTGSFVIMNLGAERHASQHGLLTTLALGENLAPVYAFEGSVFIAGAAIQWLRDELKILASAAESEAMASSVPDNGGVYLVPAFVGLGAPYWEPRARGSLVGLTRGSNRNHLVRAALESMAFQTREVVLAMEADSSLSMSELKVDGGAVPNNFLMQFQADLLGCDVLRPAVHETTALGAAFLAGLSTGLWKDVDEVRELCALERRFRPAMPFERREQLWAGWQRAVAQVLAGVS